MQMITNWWDSFLEKDLRFQVVIAFSVILLIVSIALFIIVLRLRARKSRADRKASELIDQIEPIILSLIYEEEDEVDWDHEIVNLRNILTFSMYEFHSYARLSDYLIQLHKQLEGDSAKKIERIYRDLEMPPMTLKLLKDGKWHHKVKAISALSEFRIKNYLFEVIQYMDHPQRLVRDEAQFGAIVLGGKRATGSIVKLNYEMSKWQQLRLIEQCAQLDDEIKSDVLSWMNSQNESLIELALRMCIRMGWYEAIENIPRFISHKREEIRLLSVEAIGELGSADLISELLHRFEVESRKVQIRTLMAIGELDADGRASDFLRGQIMYADYEVALAAAHALYETTSDDEMREFSARLEEDRVVLIEQVLYGAV